MVQCGVSYELLCINCTNLLFKVKSAEKECALIGSAEMSARNAFVVPVQLKCRTLQALTRVSLRGYLDAIFQ